MLKQVECAVHIIQLVCFFVIIFVWSLNCTPLMKCNIRCVSYGMGSWISSYKGQGQNCSRVTALQHQKLRLTETLIVSLISWKRPLSKWDQWQQSPVYCHWIVYTRAPLRQQQAITITSETTPNSKPRYKIPYQSERYSLSERWTEESFEIKN